MRERITMLKFCLLLLSVLWIVGYPAYSTASQRGSLSLEVFGNAIEGAPAPQRPNVTTEAEMGRKVEWWIQLGEVQPQGAGSWKLIGDTLRCGLTGGAPAAVVSTNSPAIHYLTASITTTLSVVNQVGPAELLKVDLSVALQKLTKLDPAGKPQYELSMQTRTIFLPDGDSVVLLLTILNEKEKAFLGLHEALFRIRARLAGNEERTIYSKLSVASDLDGAELLLDGGAVGRTSAGKETILQNVLVGNREVAVRDASGHAVSKVVFIKPGRTCLLALNQVGANPEATARYLAPLGKNTQGYEEYRRQRDGAVVVKIPAGEFLMGNRDTERQPLEHRVYVSEFLMDKTPVTWGQYKKFARATGTPLPPNEPYWGIHDDHPASFVTWDEARAYCAWVGGRLPTEAEREKAARGTDERMYPWGNEEPTPERAVYRHTWGNAATDVVSSHPRGASPYGLREMGGNVWEWCADWYDEKYYEVSPARDPKGPRSGRARVVRGGSWDSRPSVLSSSCRNFGYRGYREGDFGFRCAMDSVIEPPKRK